MELSEASTATYEPSYWPFWVAFAAGAGLAFSYLLWSAERAWDMDIIFSFSMLVFLPIAFAFGALPAFFIGVSFDRWRIIKYRCGYSSRIALFVILGGLLFMNTASHLGQMSEYGQSHFYGWPFPALGTNYIESIEKEIQGTTRIYHGVGILWPFFIFDTLFAAALLLIPVYFLELRDLKRANKP